MTRSEFIVDPDVRQMIHWLRERIESEGLFIHRYTIRRKNQAWACRGLYDAFRQYVWRNNDWTTTKKALAGYRLRLRAYSGPS